MFVICTTVGGGAFPSFYDSNYNQLNFEFDVIMIVKCVYELRKTNLGI